MCCGICIQAGCANAKYRGSNINIIYHHNPHNNNSKMRHKSVTVVCVCTATLRWHLLEYITCTLYGETPSCTSVVISQNWHHWSLIATERLYAEARLIISNEAVRETNVERNKSILVAQHTYHASIICDLPQHLWSWQPIWLSLHHIAERLEKVTWPLQVAYIPQLGWLHTVQWWKEQLIYQLMHFHACIQSLV